MEEQAGRDLSAEELAAVPEVSILPDGARILYTKAIGTYDGARDDNLDPSAVFDCFYVCPGQFHDIVRWVAGRLAARGWPAGTEVTNGSLPWHMWTRAKDQISLIDFTTSDWTGFPTPPSGWSMLRMEYARKPARDFVSDAEHHAWFNDSWDKGERWRHRRGTK